MRAAAMLAAAAALLAVSAAAAPAHRGPAHGGPVHRAAPAAARDWSRMVVATPQGGFRMGNPAARVKLVEYGSLACPHCRHFEETGYQPLVQKYVRTGRVSYEFRTLIISAPDVSVTLLAHCAGAGSFFPMAAAVYAAQPQWVARIKTLGDAEMAEIERMDDTHRILRLAVRAGFPQIAARFGVTAARARQCLVDPAGQKRLTAIAEAANRMGIDRTPTFLVNGRPVDGGEWGDLEPALRAAGG